MSQALSYNLDHIIFIFAQKYISQKLDLIVFSPQVKYVYHHCSCSLMPDLLQKEEKNIDMVV